MAFPLSLSFCKSLLFHTLMFLFPPLSFMLHPCFCNPSWKPGNGVRWRGRGKPHPPHHAQPCSHYPSFILAALATRVCLEDCRYFTVWSTSLEIQIHRPFKNSPLNYSLTNFSQPDQLVFRPRFNLTFSFPNCALSDIIRVI